MNPPMCIRLYAGFAASGLRLVRGPCLAAQTPEQPLLAVHEVALRTARGFNVVHSALLSEAGWDQRGFENLTDLIP